MPCTTLLVGKSASFDGSTLMARAEDSGASEFVPKKFLSIGPEDQPKHYKSVCSTFEMDLDEKPMRYTACPDSTGRDGIFGEAGINEENVAMTATETITSNARVLGADPLVEEGIAEEDYVTLVLPYIHSARDGVKRLGSLLEKYGTYEMNGIGFQDVNEIWWFETIGGHHWIAKKVPDDCYVVMPNQQGIDIFDMMDAFGEQKNHMCSADLKEFILDNHLDLSMEKVDIAFNSAFDVRAAFGSKTDADHCYNTPRAWFMERYLNPTTFRWEGELADFTPESNDLPWAMVPEHKVTIEDMKYCLSGYYQSTPYNPYGSYGNKTEAGKYRPIGINRNSETHICQIRPYAPKEIQAIEWLSLGSNAFNASVPFYTNIENTPEYLSCTSTKVTTDSFYWSNRLIAALADAHYSKSIAGIERYQEDIASFAHQHIRLTDKQAAGKTNITSYLEEANASMMENVREKTDKLLASILDVASKEMKNSYSRSDG